MIRSKLRIGWIKMLDIYERLKTEPRLRIGIADADLIDHGTRHPNLALLKISAYCKSCGHGVELMADYDAIEDYDLVFLSCVFSFTNLREDILDLPYVYYGGTGIFPDGGEDLPDEVEHMCPDYSLYEPYVESQLALGRRRSMLADYLDYSIGFTTRGCFRKCSFCVNKKYNRVVPHSPVSEFLDEARPYIYLWDDNFLAYSRWREVLVELEATGKPFQFRQGLDVRLMTDEKAKVLSRCKYHGDFIFAFDHLEDRDLIEKKLLLWRKWTEKGTRLYVLSAYNSQDEHDIESVFERIAILMRYDCLPYIMRYESYKKSHWRALYVNIARWCNQPNFFKKKSFREFCEANQAYHKNKDTLCSAYRAMTEFEAEFPEIAKRYFDLRFEEESMLKRFGRRFFNRPSDEELEGQHDTWTRFSSGEMTAQDALQAYYSKRLDIVCAGYLAESGRLMGGEGQKLFSLLASTPLEEAYGAILGLDELEPISSANVPQFSQIESAYRVPEILLALGEGQEFEKLGIYLHYEPHKKEGANKKYGENHAKLATLIDLADIVNTGKMTVVPTKFGELFCQLPDDEKADMAARLMLRIPIVQHMLRDSADVVHIADHLRLFADSTKKRRIPNIKKVCNLIDQQLDESDMGLRSAIKKIEA